MKIDEIRFTVWQFVRLMVHLEEQKKMSPAEQALFDAWKDVWQPLDQQLGQLATSDAEAYGDMMMNQDVVIEHATTAQAATAKSVLDAVVGEMDRAMKAGGDDTVMASLKFERHELHQLARKLGRYS